MMMVVDGRSVMGKQGFGGAVDLFKVDSNRLEFQTLHSIALHCIADHFEYIALHLKQISLLQCDTRQKILLPCNELTSQHKRLLLVSTPALCKKRSNQDCIAELELICVYNACSVHGEL